MLKPSIMPPNGVCPGKDSPSVSGESLIIMNGVVCAVVDSNDTAEGGVLSRLLAPNWNAAGDRVRTGIIERSCSGSGLGVPTFHVAAGGIFIMPGGLFAALFRLNDCVMELFNMPILASSCLNTGESCLVRLFPLAISSPFSFQTFPFCEGYDPKLALGDDSEGLFLLRRPEESDEESCVELSGEAEETTDRD
jgi:hypothetical protein